jgi:imidazolonepropionase-like amidohydrolase
MRRFLILLTTFALALPAQITLLSHATVIDGTGRAPMPNTSILIDGGRIAAIGPASKVKPPAGAQVIDLSGQTIIPGIIDLHSHIGIDTPAKIRMFALYGVTSTIGMGGDGDEVLKIRDAQRHGEIDGARIYTVQQRFEFEKGGPEQARMMVDALADKHADAVKVVIDNRRGKAVKLPREFAAAAIDEAHKRHLKALAHIHDYEDAKFVIDQNIDMLAHQIRDREVDDALIAEMKQKRIAVTSTLTRELSDYVYADSPDWLNDPFLAKWMPAQRIAQAKGELKERQAANPEIELNRKDFEFATKNLRKMFLGGVRIAFGTDSGNGPPRFEGYFDHLEMQLMVKYGGMTPMQVIQAFSKTNSEVLGIDKDYGTLAKGKMADLLVLEKSPVDDISNTKTLRAVYIGGREAKAAGATGPLF